MTQTQKIDWRRPCTAAILALLVISAVFLAEHLTPFGNRNLLISDMGTQYMAFLTSLRHALLVHNFQLYSFSQSLGGSVVPTLGYYLMSPFNLIIVFFSAQQVPIAVSVIIMLKIATIAFTMTYFLQHHFHSNRWGLVLFGVAFSMSGFVAINYYDIMWLDALIWLPLVINGVDRILRTGRTSHFFWWLLVSIVTDFYLGYMTCLFVICYFVYAVFEANQGQLKLGSLLKKYSHQIINTLVTAFLSVLSSLFILIPTAVGMLQTAKTTRSMADYKLWPTFSFEFISQLGVGGSNYTDRLSHAPTVFVGTLVLVLALYFFVHPQVTRSSKKHAAWLLIVLFLSMWIRALNTAWHMFQQPEGFPYRNAFFFSFVLILLAAQCWLANPRLVAKKWALSLSSLLGVLMIFGWYASREMPKLVEKYWPGTIANHYYQTNELATKNLILALIYLVLVTGTLILTQRRLQQFLLAGLVTTELGGNFLLGMHGTHFGSQSKYASTYSTELSQMSSVSDPDGQLYRVDNANTLINRAYQETYNNYNDPLLFNFHDINAYSSTLNESTRLTLHSLGLFSKNARRISSEGLSPVTALLLGVKYNVTLQSTAKKMATNPGYVGIGFPVSNEFAQTKLSQSNTIQNQEKLLQAIQPSSAAYFANADVTKASTKRRTGKVKTYHYRQTIHLTTTASGPLYLDDTLGITKYSTLTVNGKTVAPSVNANHYKLLLNLGTFKKGSQVTIKLNSRHQSFNSTLQLASLDMTNFVKAAQTLKTGSFNPTYHASGVLTRLTGTVNNTTGKRWLYLAIPYDQGWHAKVNGQTVKSKTVLGGLTAIPIKAGKNQVQLTYHVPGLWQGSLISAASLLTYFGYGWWRRRRHLGETES